MARPTKKALREALTPLRKAAERFACSRLLNGDRSAVAPEEIVWEGFAIQPQYIRRARVVCNVPAPYHSLWIYYRVVDLRTGTQVSDGRTGAETVDWLFHPKNPHRAGV